MNSRKENEALFASLEALYQDSAIRDRKYYPDFRRGWDALFRRALEMEENYLPENPDAVFTLEHRYAGLDLCFHFDQLKMAQWYERELKRRSRAIFTSKRLKRSRKGVLSFHDSPCSYFPEAPEKALDEEIRNIMVCAMPSLPPQLYVVYGNKWVESRVSPLLRQSLPVFLIQTDYVPAFLGSPFEVCLYLFFMDYCIIKENYRKVKDADLRQFLHVFRPSPMLAIKGILK